jgi:hypothetical protein
LRILLAGLLLAAGAAIAQGKFSELTASDEFRLNKQRAVVLAELSKRYGAKGLTGKAADIPLLQRLLDDKVFGATQTYELQSIGVAFGDVLANDLGMRWVVVSDEYGTDPTLRYKDTTIQVNALTMISRRVEDGQPLDLEAIRRGVRSNINEILKSGDFK